MASGTPPQQIRHSIPTNQTQREGAKPTPIKTSTRKAVQNLTAAHTYSTVDEESELIEEPVLEKVLNIDITGDQLSAILGEEVKKGLAEQVDKITKPAQGKREVHVYCPSAILLNTLSLAAYNHLHPEPTPDDTAIVFLLNPDCQLPGDVFDTQIKPDIVAKKCTLAFLEEYLQQLHQSVNDQVPPNIHSHRPSHGEHTSPVELKKITSAQNQQAHYCRMTKAARVDMVRVFGACAKVQGYQFTRVDACGAVVSPTYGWSKTDFNPLLRYVIAVYKSESERDKDCFTYVQGTEQIWTIKLGEVLTVRPFYATYPPGRATWVAAGFNEEGERRLVKVSNIDVNVRSSEQDLYEKAHSKGWIPGLARAVETKVISSTPVTEGEVPIARRKTAVVLGSTGEPLNNCGSVFEFLKVMYDALQSTLHNPLVRVAIPHD